MPSSSLIIPPLFPIQQSNPIQYFDEKDCKFRVKSFSRSRVPSARAAWNHQQRSSRVLPPVTATHHRSPRHQPPTPTPNTATPEHRQQRRSRVLPPATTTPTEAPNTIPNTATPNTTNNAAPAFCPPLPTPQRLSTANTNPQHRNA
ncbi:uncharacterized protein ATNIH1004_001897 [Aspergillus tanneri]|uniref:Uncharacterized protein n=1 Tax=Aspergillus tanneri TaxID=1220188 RepID=A0A5M9M311_9EURO|nr:uncharacterized protein ATNIH1004_001897 [Aspergillus tanneri]KAA8641432.1 hypothetical protein ATNIH1004_001897 [Aspergillus tanneri]